MERVIGNARGFPREGIVPASRCINPSRPRCLVFINRYQLMFRYDVSCLQFEG